MSNLFYLQERLRERFKQPITLFPPLGMGHSMRSPNVPNVNIVVIGVQFDFETHNWKYLIVDEGFQTAPLWVSSEQLFNEVGY